MWKRFDKILEGFRSPGCKKYIRFFFRELSSREKGGNEGKSEKKGNKGSKRVPPSYQAYIIVLHYTYYIYIHMCNILYITHIYMYI